MVGNNVNATQGIVKMKRELHVKVRPYYTECKFSGLMTMLCLPT